MAEFNLGNFEKLFHSDDKEVGIRACDNAEAILPYVSRKRVPDQELIEELHDFNEFAKKHEGFTVYDEDKPPMESGILEISNYLVSLGRAR